MSHWWKCDGPCQLSSPYFGLVKRTMNRAPGPSDYWWRSHTIRCGGRFVKVKEPVEFTMKRVKGLVDSGVGSVSFKVSLNDFKFEYGLNTDAQKTAKAKISYTFVSVPRADEECPICLKRMPKEDLSSHLKGCEELQKLVENVVDVNEDFVKNEIESNSITLPLCEIMLNKNGEKEHLEKCDGLKGIFDDVGKTGTDVCPLCCKVVRGELSSHVSECLTLEMETSSDESFERNMPKEVEDEKCLVCKKELCGTQLKVHLENCEALKGLFDDDVVVQVEERDENCNRRVEKCPVCCNDFTDLANHLRTCLSSCKELCDDSTSIDCDAHTQEAKACIAPCEDHIYPDQNHFPKSTRKKAKTDSEPLIFCRECSTFYSITVCPVCGVNSTTV